MDDPVELVAFAVAVADTCESSCVLLGAEFSLFRTKTLLQEAFPQAALEPLSGLDEHVPADEFAEMITLDLAFDIAHESRLLPLSLMHGTKTLRLLSGLEPLSLQFKIFTSVLDVAVEFDVAILDGTLVAGEPHRLRCSHSVELLALLF